MGRLFYGLGFLFLIFSFQNCSGVNFGGNTSENSVAVPDTTSPDLVNLSVGRCFDYADGGSSGACSSSLKQTTITTSVNANGDYVVRITFPTEFVDNTYGVNSIGWGNRGHTLKDLVGSDHVEVSLTDAQGTEVIHTKLDYISEDKKGSGVYITQAEKVNVGNEADILEVRSSLVENFVTQGYLLTTDSPATDANFTPNATYPNWIYEVWYEVTVSASAFQAGGGFGSAVITSIHASPSKIGENTCEVIEAPCEEPMPNVCEDNPDDPDDDGVCDDILNQRD